MMGPKSSRTNGSEGAFVPGLRDKHEKNRFWSSNDEGILRREASETSPHAARYFPLTVSLRTSSIASPPSMTSTPTFPTVLPRTVQLTLTGPG